MDGAKLEISASLDYATCILKAASMVCTPSMGRFYSRSTSILLLWYNRVISKIRDLLEPRSFGSLYS